MPSLQPHSQTLGTSNIPTRNINSLASAPHVSRTPRLTEDLHPVNLSPVYTSSAPDYVMNSQPDTCLPHHTSNSPSSRGLIVSKCQGTLGFRLRLRVCILRYGLASGSGHIPIHSLWGCPSCVVVLDIACNSEQWVEVGPAQKTMLQL